MHRRTGGKIHTGLVCVDIFPRDLFLLFDLACKMGLALLQHLELCPQVKDDILGCIFPLLRGATAKPTPDT